MVTPARFPTDPERRVLVVDDDEFVARATARKVRSFGYLADLAGSGAEAIVLSGDHDYSVVLTDLLMPNMDGMQLMSLLARKSEITSFILMTGTPDFSEHDSRAVEGRLTTVIAKPLRDEELERALHDAFELANKRRSASLPPEAVARLLLLEDSLSDAFLTTEALKTLGGFEVTHVVRLSEAVELLHAASFDTVITDLTLPDARGLGAVLRLRECAPDATLIVVSSVADEVLALRVIELGAQDFIVKGAGDVESMGRAIRFARVRRESELRLALLAHTDGLTGLANRRALNQAIEQALSLAKRQQTGLGLMYLDLDGFKAINDAHGHEAGDVLLQHVATRIRGCVRGYDLVARIGGDEFAVMVTNLGPGALGVAAGRIARALAIPFQLGPDRGAEAVTITASIGTSEYPNDAANAGLLVKLADDAMYAAKRAGKSRVCSARPTNAILTDDPTLVFRDRRALGES